MFAQKTMERSDCVDFCVAYYKALSTSTIDLMKIFSKSATLTVDNLTYQGRTSIWECFHKHGILQCLTHVIEVKQLGLVELNLKGTHFCQDEVVQTFLHVLGPLLSHQKFRDFDQTFLIILKQNHCFIKSCTLNLAVESMKKTTFDRLAPMFEKLKGGDCIFTS